MDVSSVPDSCGADDARVLPRPAPAPLAQGREEEVSYKPKKHVKLHVFPGVDTYEAISHEWAGWMKDQNAELRRRVADLERVGRRIIDNMGLDGSKYEQPQYNQALRDLRKLLK